MALTTSDDHISIDDVLDYEDGIMTPAQVIEFFQKLIDTGMAWQLQGSYGRTAAALIAAGEIVQHGKGAE